MVLFYCCFYQQVVNLWFLSEQFKNQKIWETEEDDMKKICEKPVIKGISDKATVKKGQTLRLKCVLDS